MADKVYDSKTKYFEQACFVEIFKGIFDHSPNGIVVVNENAQITHFNETAEILTEMKRDALIGSRVSDVFPQINFDQKKTIEESVEIISLNGKELHTKMFSIHNLKGLKATVLMMQDLSQEIKLTTQLEQSQHVIEELKNILEASFDGFLVTDGEGNVLMVNQSYYRVTGIEKEEMMGKNMRDLLHPLYMKNSVAFLVIEKRQPVSLHHSTRNGRNIIVTGTPLFDDDGSISKVVINVRDISEIYELREELLKAREMEKLYFKKLSNDKSYKKSKESSVIVSSDVMQEVFSLAHKVSSFDATVLISGESGVGKEEIAKYIHKNSLRKEKPFVVINCGAIPEQLLESELFGYETGAFTGATKEGKTGLFEAADGGTLFLDEIGEMPLNLQVKLLRVLESREITRVGAVKPTAVDVRLLAATNKNLEEKVASKEFREDLFYRLNVIQIKIPPLRERIGDIAPLALHFLQQSNSKYGLSKRLTYEVIKELESYQWSGNIRQLKNTIENMIIVSNNEYLQLNDLPWLRKKDYETEAISGINKTEDAEIPPLKKAIEQLEKELLQKAQEKYKSTRKIAKAIEVNQSTVVRKLKKYNIAPINNDEA